MLLQRHLNFYLAFLYPRIQSQHILLLHRKVVFQQPLLPEEYLGYYLFLHLNQFVLDSFCRLQD